MIDTNEIIKMKVKYPGKPMIWRTPHFYLCWCDEEHCNKFLIFTSNFFSIFLNNPSMKTSDFQIVQMTSNLPFHKQTFIVLSESYDIFNFKEEPKMLKIPNCFEQNKLNDYQQHAALAKSIVLTEGDYVLVK